MKKEGFFCKIGTFLFFLFLHRKSRKIYFKSKELDHILVFCTWSYFNSVRPAFLCLIWATRYLKTFKKSFFSKLLHVEWILKKILKNWLFFINQKVKSFGWNVTVSKDKLKGIYLNPNNARISAKTCSWLTCRLHLRYVKRIKKSSIKKKKNLICCSS